MYADFHPHTHKQGPRCRDGIHFVVAGRADHHPELTEKPDHTLHHCAVCSTYIILSPRTVIYAQMRPDVPILCCLCGEMSAALLRAVLPGAHTFQEPVPDLATSGMFN